ncbi:MAG TPA: EamA family transporter, partial [Flavipsychrobacter sp.]|nr:EamA family transporter [Flavipsychrobacter sp.]
IILAIGYSFNKTIDLSKKNLLHQGLVGFLLITMGNGLVSWGEKYIPSGVAALICSLMPICAVIINLIQSKKDKLNGIIIFGMSLGMCGVGLIFKDDLEALNNKYYLYGMLATFIATTSWALGSVLNKNRYNPTNPTFNAGLQVVMGGIFLFAFSPLIDSYQNMDLLHPDVLYPLIYLIVFGSILAYTAYMFALKELPVGIVTLYAYVNPLVAVVLGYFWLDENLTGYTLLAFISIIAGVYLVNYGYKRQQRKAIDLPMN